MLLKRLLIRCLFAVTLVANVATLPAVAQAQAAAYNFDIPAQSLSNALEVFGRTCNQQLVFDKMLLRDKQSNALVGHYSAEEGIARLLEGSGLTFKRTAKGVLAIQTIETPNTSGSPHSAYSEEYGQISEIIVTAQKKSERLQDVPVPVTVLNADKLADNGQVLLRDYAPTVPAFNVTPSYQGYQYLSIRGIATGGTQNPTVGVTVDDVPFGSSTTNGGNGVPDIDPGDLARIEVLRGPQGTLYGANSMGGLLKFVTKDPSPEGYSGRVEAGTSAVYNGAEPGYNIRASANIPLSDSLAVRVSGFRRQDPGYIDNPTLNIKGINEAQTDGARLAALWRPSDVFALKLSALYQYTKGNGASQVTRLPGLGDFQQSYLPGIGGYDRSVQAYSATLNYKIGSVNLTSVTGYNENRYKDTQDLTYASGPDAQFYFGVAGAALANNFPTHKFTQEIRLSTPIAKNFEWLVGGFFTHERANFYQAFPAIDPVTGRIAGDLGPYSGPSSYEEYAGFTDLTYHVTDQFDIQLGGRYSKIDVRSDTEIDYAGPYNGPTTTTIPPIEAKDNAVTYLLTPRFKVSQGLMVYARLASGYRPGAPNATQAVLQGAVSKYNPDRTYNYEVGAKGDLFDHMLSFDASLYYIDWKNIQIKLRTPNQVVGYAGNAGAAKSEGVEFSVESKPWTGMTISGWVAYDDAVITQIPSNTPVYLYPGDPLAYSSRWSGYVSLEQEFPLWSGAAGFVGSSATYVGDRKGIFTNAPTAIRQDYPAYAKADLRAGVRYGSWTANIYANNVADIRALANGGRGFSPPYAYVYIEPRTVGISLVKTF